MKRRILHLWFHSLETDWLHKHRQQLAGLSVVTSIAERGRNVIVQANAKARQTGISAGLSLADARAICPSIVAVDHSPDLIIKVLHAMADWCDRYTPHVSPCDDDSLWLDITGCAHLYGGEANLLQHIHDAFRTFGYSCSVAIAGTPGIAWAVARYTENGIIPSGAEQSLLAALPPEALRCDYDTAQNLKRLGLRTIGELLKIPRAALTKRFGKGLCHALDLALGELKEPISPRKPVIPFTTRYEFLEPVQHEEPIRIILADLLPKLCKQLEEAQRGARQLCLICFRVDGYVQKITIGTNSPSVSPEHLLKLLNQKLAEIDAGLGIELIILAAVKTDLLKPKKTDLLESRIGNTELIAEVADTIAGKLGSGSIYQQHPQESHIIERAVAYRPPLETLRFDFLPKDRPTRLLRWPCPIDVIARVPDDPPMQFTWKGKTYRVSKADGPERIEGEWWRGTRELRDYYCIEDATGHRYGVYRSGNYLPDKQPQWFIYGQFG